MRPPAPPTPASALRGLQAGDVVIRQGDQGDDFFIAQEGAFKVLVDTDGSSAELVHTYMAVAGQPRPSFGELALLYGANPDENPASDMQQCELACILWLKSHFPHSLRRQTEGSKRHRCERWRAVAVEPSCVQEVLAGSSGAWHARNCKTEYVCDTARPCLPMCAGPPQQQPHTEDFASHGDAGATDDCTASNHG